MARFLYRYVLTVEKFALAGYTSNDEIARLLRVRTNDVLAWRKQYPVFDDACELALHEANAVVASFAYERAQEDDAMARYWLDRRAPAFKPKQQTDHTSNGHTLAGLLAEHGRMSDEEAAERGLVGEEGEGETVELTEADEAFYEAADYED